MQIEQFAKLRPAPLSAQPAESLALPERESTLPQLLREQPDAAFLKKEQQFLSEWRDVIAQTPERLEFMKAWYRSLTLGFGTPVNELFETLRFRETSLGEDLAPAYRVTFSGRGNLFETLKQNDAPLSVPQDLELLARIETSCGCCHSSMQAETHARDPEQFPIVLYRPSPDILMIPNRFPWDIGGVLILPYSHDDLAARTPTFGVPCEPGMTRGALVTQPYLESLFKSSEQFNLAIFQNHPCSGMSIPHHIHAHGIPAEFPKSSIMTELSRSAERPHDHVSFQRSTINVTEVLVISSADETLTIEAAAETLQKLEQAGIIYTFACYDGCIAIAPELWPADAEPHRRGARTLLHWFQEEELVEQKFGAASSYPAPGAFDWSQFLPGH